MSPQSYTLIWVCCLIFFSFVFILVCRALLSIWRIGPRGFREARDALEGPLPNPRVNEGMEIRDGKVVKAKGLSPDYLQMLFRD